MNRETSAGGIIVRKRAHTWDVLVIRDKNDVLTFPKGLVENGEDLVEAARREILEEVGISDITLTGPLPSVTYTYRRNGVISKTVHYFLFQSGGIERLRAQTAEGIHNAMWIPLDEAIEKIGYPKTNTILLQKVKQWTLNSHPT